MDNPLTDEQIIELNEIIKLPREEQAKRLQVFLKTLTKEQIEYLKQHQTQECIFCGIVLNKIPSYKVYEDNDAVVVLDINPASKGHLLIIPKSHVKYSYELNPSIFTLANSFAKRIKDVLNADSNILVNNGELAGQKIGHIVINVIPRYEKDGIDLSWNVSKLNEHEMTELAYRLRLELNRKEPKLMPEVGKEGLKEFRKEKKTYIEFERLP